NQPCDSDHQEQTKLIARKKCDEQTGQQQYSKRADEKHSTDKAPLLTDRRENVVVVDCSRGQKAELDLGVGCLKTFSRPTAGSNGDKRLIDRPRRTLFVDVGMGKSGESRLLIWFKHEIRRDRNHSEKNQQNTNQVS